MTRDTRDVKEDTMWAKAIPSSSCMAIPLRPKGSTWGMTLLHRYDDLLAFARVPRSRAVASASDETAGTYSSG